MTTPRSAFDADLGTAQGRIVPAGWTPPEGTHAFVLGHDRAGVRRRLAANDSLILSQSWDLTGVKWVRVRVRFRAPEPLPVNLSWVFSATLAGETYLSRVVDRTQEFYEFALPTAYTGANVDIPEVAFALVFLAPAGIHEVDLPAVYLDAVTSEPSLGVVGQVEIASRYPEPGQTGVPHRAAVSGILQEISGTDRIDVTRVDVTINGVAAMVAGGLVNGWTGGLTVLPDSLCVSYELDPPAPFASLEVVTVQVHAVSLSLGAVGDFSYAFTAADTVGPVVEGALAVDPLTVRVSFDEPLAPASAGGLSSYVLTLDSGAPAVVPGVVAAVLFGDREVLLTLDGYATRGAIYRVTVDDLVTDLVGNGVSGFANFATFAGYAWAVPAGRDINLFRSLPEVVQELDTSGEHELFLGVMQEVFDLFFALADKLPDQLDPDRAREDVVDLMLAELGSPFEALPLDLTAKRRLLGLLVEIYRTKGTGPGIVDAIRLFLGIDVTLRVYAWAPYPIGEAVIGSTFVLGSSSLADIYTFEIVVTQFLTAAERVAIRRILEAMKVAHEHYRLIEPAPAGPTFDHWELGFSALDTQTLLH